MRINRRFVRFELVFIALVLMLTGARHSLRADTGACGGATITLPFNDVMSSAFFCQIAAAYFSGLTNGTSATTYSPGNVVTREQMAAFVTRTLDQSLKRGSRRAALGQWWNSLPDWAAVEYQFGNSNSFEGKIQSDGHNVYLAWDDRIYAISLVDGALRMWGGLGQLTGVLCQGGYVWVIGRTAPGRLYRLHPFGATATLMSSGLGNNPEHLAYDGARIWTANADGSVSIYDARGGALQTVATGFSSLGGIVYDGAHIWVSARGGMLDDRLLKLDANGNAIASVRFLSNPGRLLFDGINIWLLNPFAHSVLVVRVKDANGNPSATPTVLATLTGNGLDGPRAAAFDGERVLIANQVTVSLWKATDLTPLGNFGVANSSTGEPVSPFTACSDGQDFWIAAYRVGGIVLKRY